MPQLVEALQEVSSPMTFLLLAIGGHTAFQAARKAGH